MKNLKPLKTMKNQKVTLSVFDKDQNQKDYECESFESAINKMKTLDSRNLVLAVVLVANEVAQYKLF